MTHSPRRGGNTCCLFLSVFVSPLTFWLCPTVYSPSCVSLQFLCLSLATFHPWPGQYTSPRAILHCHLGPGAWKLEPGSFLLHPAPGISVPFSLTPLSCHLLDSQGPECLPKSSSALLGPLCPWGLPPASLGPGRCWADLCSNSRGWDLGKVSGEKWEVGKGWQGNHAGAAAGWGWGLGPQLMPSIPRASLWSSCVVLPLLALTWMSAVLAVTDRRSALFQILFAVFDSLEGFVIVMVHCILRREVGTGGPLGTTRWGKGVGASLDSWLGTVRRERCVYLSGVEILGDSHLALVEPGQGWRDIASLSPWNLLEGCRRTFQSSWM